MSLPDQELAELYEQICQKPSGSFRCVYHGVPIFEVEDLEQVNACTDQS